MPYGRIAAAVVEEHGSVISRPGQEPRERQNGFVPGPFLQGTGLHAANGFANQLVGPSALAAGGFICSVEDEKNVVFRCFLKQPLIKVDHLFGLVIEEVNFGTDYA